MNAPNDEPDRLVEFLAEALRQVPVPVDPDPAATAARLIAEADRRSRASPPSGAEPPVPPVDVLEAAVDEADALPPYERPATVGELARRVKARLYGHAPLPADRMTAFLLAFARVQMRRPAGEAVNDWSRVPAGSVRSTLLAAGGTTVGDVGRIGPAFDTLLEADPATGQLLLLSEYAGQSVDALAALSGRSAEGVKGELAAARRWMEDELDLPAGTVPVG